MFELKPSLEFGQLEKKMKAIESYLISLVDEVKKEVVGIKNEIDELKDNNIKDVVDNKIKKLESHLNMLSDKIKTINDDVKKIKSKLKIK